MSAASFNPVVVHLVQSTVFAAVIGLATLAMRGYGARSRYWLWAGASLKFLLPFSWLVKIGGTFEWRTAPAMARPTVTFVSEQLLAPVLPMTDTPTFLHPSPSPLWPEVVWVVWLTGAAIVCLWWWRQWTPVRAAVRAAKRVSVADSPDALTVMTSPMTMEPGVVGVWRPVLLVPEGLLDQLTAAQRDALFAHERSHVRYRDNLMAAVHMAVEAIFWFHPLVWWIEHRLIDERERACDEDVLRSGARPVDYAEGILTVCRVSVRAPLPCVAGVTGSDLRGRIEAILRGAMGQPMSATRRWALVLSGLTSIGLP